MAPRASRAALGCAGGRVPALLALAAGAGACWAAGTAFASGYFAPGGPPAGRGTARVPRRSRGGEAAPSLVSDLKPDSLLQGARIGPRTTESPDRAPASRFVVGDLVLGTVVRVEQRYCLVDLNGHQGMIPASHMSEAGVADAREVVRPGTVVKAYVAQVQGGQPKLTMVRYKKMDQLGQDTLMVGQEVIGWVTGIYDWGAWVCLGGTGKDAVLPNHQVNQRGEAGTNIFDALELNQTVECWVEKICPDGTAMLTRRVPKPANRWVEGTVRRLLDEAYLVAITRAGRPQIGWLPMSSVRAGTRLAEGDTVTVQIESVEQTSTGKPLMVLIWRERRRRVTNEEASDKRRPALLSSGWYGFIMDFWDYDRER